VPSDYDLEPVEGNPFRVLHRQHGGVSFGSDPEGEQLPTGTPVGPQPGPNIGHPLEIQPLTPENPSYVHPQLHAPYIPGALRPPGEAPPVLREAHPAWIDQRLPTSKKFVRGEDEPPMLVDLQTMQQTPKLYENNVNLVRNYPGQKFRAKMSTDDVAENFINFAKDNIRWLHDQVPDDIRSRSMLWYDGGNKIVKDRAAKYGISDSAAAATIAAQSPQKDWYQNVSLADRVMEIMKGGGDNFYRGFATSPEMESMFRNTESLNKPEYQPVFDAIKGKSLHDIDQMPIPLDERAIYKAMWVRLYDQSHNSPQYNLVTPEGNFGDLVRNEDGTPSRAGWGSLREIAKGIAAIDHDGDVDALRTLMGERHKVRNFYNNLLDPNGPHGDVTIDTHAVAAALLRPLSGNSLEVAHNFANYPGKGLPSAGGSALTGIQGTYPLYAEAYRRAAQELGLLPRQLQSITWEAVRGLFQDSWKTDKNTAIINGIWDRYKQGKIDLDQARQNILKAAGGIAPPTWYTSGRSGVRPTGADYEAPWRSGNPAELPGPRLYGGRAERVGRRTGGRLAGTIAPQVARGVNGGGVDEKKPKDDPQIRYQYKPHGNQYCSRCDMFIQPDACSAVAGKIARQGWCHIFSAKHS
jgi:hypothetical protein